MLKIIQKGYHRLKGSTNLVAGLEQCEIFFQSSLPKTEKLVIVVTDGVADTNPTQRANQLRNSVLIFPFYFDILFTTIH